MKICEHRATGAISPVNEWSHRGSVGVTMLLLLGELDGSIASALSTAVCHLHATGAGGGCMASFPPLLGSREAVCACFLRGDGLGEGLRRASLGSPEFFRLFACCTAG